MTEQVKLGIQRIECAFDPSQANDEKRTAPLTFHTGATMMRSSFFDGRYMLRFSMDPAHVRMGRLTSGAAPLLDGHNDGRAADVLGVIENAAIVNGIGQAVARFSNRDAVTPIWQDVQAGILRNASMGAVIHKLREDTAEGDKLKSFTAIDWEALEVSIVPVGADAGAGFRAAAGDTFDCEIEFRASAQRGNEMDITELDKTQLKNEADDFRARAKVGKVSTEFAEGIATKLEAGTLTRKQATDMLIDKMAADSQGLEIRSHTGGGVVMRDHKDGLVERMAEAVTCRYTGKAPSDAAREFVGASMVDMARELLEATGQRVSTRSHSEIIRLGLHTTSDFPGLLTETGNRMLMAAYAAAQPAIKRAARRSTAKDFRTKSLLRLGEAPALLEVNEHGEITRGSRVESKESYRLRTYARIFGITRQALVNDDLGAFADTAGAFGLAAATLEGSLLTDLLVSNPAMEDTVALFHTDHANMSTGGGSALGVTGLTAARLALRKTLGLDGATILDIPPALLLVPAALETTGQQTLSAVFAATNSNVNPFADGKLTLLVDPRLDASSTAVWYLLADPGGPFPVLEYSHLEGQEGLFTETRIGFDVEGVEIKARVDFGCGAIGFRGAVRSAGS